MYVYPYRPKKYRTAASAPAASLFAISGGITGRGTAVTKGDGVAAGVVGTADVLVVVGVAVGSAPPSPHPLIAPETSDAPAAHASHRVPCLLPMDRN